MTFPIFRVDAFTSIPFRGNPAAVCLLEGWLDDSLLQAVAAENNLSETAFFVPLGDGYELRWFTPKSEVKLCGHATLATAFVLFRYVAREKDSVEFSTRWHGILKAKRSEALIEMDFPTFVPWECKQIPQKLLQGLKLEPRSVVQIEDNFFAVYENEDEIRRIAPDFRLLEALHPAGVGITAPGNDCDFVSRYFAPSYGIDEDPVTGSTHCSLVPYWAARLGKTTMHARQLSARGGEMWCEVKGNRISLRGDAVLTLRGEVVIGE